MAKESDFLRLPWLSKSFGSTSIAVGSPADWRLDDGSLVMTFGSPYYANSHVRSNHSINRRRPLAGSSTPWIPPSSYFREQHQFTVYSSGRYSVPGSGYVEGPLGSNPNSMYDSTMTGNPYFTGMLGDFNGSSPDVLGARDASMTKALVDLGDSKAGLGENLAQAVKTADLFLDTGADIIRVGLALKSGKLWKVIKDANPSDLKKVVKSGAIPKKMADQWLAFHYGWRPLAMDAYGIYELLKEQLEPALLVHGRGQHRGPVYQQNGESAPGGFVFPSYVFHERARYSARCGLTGRIDSNDYSRTLNRVGLLNPAELVWDLIPFSFVVDWVLPIGDVLKGLSAPTGLSFVGGHVSERWDRNITVQVSGAYQYRDFPRPEMLLQRTGIGRTALNSFPVPIPYIRSPFLGSSRIATVGALLTKLLT